MKLPRDSKVLRHRLAQAIWDANHSRERELDAIFDTIEAYMNEEAEHAATDWVIVAVHLSTEGVAYFWGPNFSGYTRDLLKAGRYTEAEAKAREKWTERMEVAVPFSEAQSVAHPAVCDDDAHRWFHRRFANGKPGGQVAGCSLRCNHDRPCAKQYLHLGICVCQESVDAPGAVAC